MGMRVLDPELLRRARGERSLGEIAALGGGKFKRQQVRAWEAGEYLPRPQTLPYYLKALGVSYEKVSKPIVVAANGNSHKQNSVQSTKQ